MRSCPRAKSPSQINRLHLPTAPRKPTDTRAFRAETVQAEAISPDELAHILREAIEDRAPRKTIIRLLVFAPSDFDCYCGM